MKIMSKFILLLAFCLSLFAYEPPLEQVEVNGVKIYVLGDDTEEGIEDGLIDQFWLADLIKSKKALPKGLHLIDVRKAKKFKASHIKGAINAPYDRENEKIDTTLFPKDGILVFYCNTGIMSSEARTSVDEDLAKRIFVFDIAYKCDKEYKNCAIKPNDSL